MRSLTCVLGLVIVLLVGSPATGAQETTLTSDAAEGVVDCITPSFLSNALIECAGLEGTPSLDAAVADAAVGETDASEPTVLTAASSIASEAIVFPSYCRVKVDAIFWGGRQWLELAEALRDDNSECAEHYVTIPPRDNDKTQPRPPAQYTNVRVLNPRIHPVAEINFIAWRAWVREFPTRTFYDAGVRARRRMVTAGLDVTRGETWALNELSVEVLENVPGWRADVLEILRGLYDGEPGMPKARGIVFNIGLKSNIDDATAYKANLQAWLTDGPFWTAMNTYVDFFAHEVYASSLNWGVAGVPRATRAEYLNDYFHHVTSLAEAGPETADAARQFLRRTYLPLGNALWPHPVGDTNLLTAKAMSQFISTQVYAMRHYANTHPQTAPQGRIGFGWAPIEGVAGYSVEGRNMIRDRLASAIHESSEQGTNSQMGACGRPGEHVWCEGDVEDAVLKETWKTFSSWD